ncbi:MAG: PIG-L family deacetylase [Bryobacteraceae bacterium]
MRFAAAILGIVYAAPVCMNAQSAEQPVLLVIAAGTDDCFLAAGGTVASLVERGAKAILIRVTNDDKSAWNLSPEEAALRNRQEAEQAGKILGFQEVISMGYRAHELADVPFTSLRDRLILYIRHYRPTVLFIPNPYAEYDRVLDHHYAGRAAEDAWRSAAIDNYVPPFGAAGVRPHTTAEIYYYAPPLDPRRREPESTATFVPQPKTLDIAAVLPRKLRAVQALKTINRAFAMQIKERLDATGRRLALLDTVDDASIGKLVEENVRGLATVAAEGSAFGQAEQFHFAGVDYQIPSRYRK